MTTPDPFRFERRLCTAAKVGALVAACLFSLVLIGMNIWAAR